MNKLGMVNLKEDFDHPKVSAPSLKRHCLYVIEYQKWLNTQLQVKDVNRVP